MYPQVVLLLFYKAREQGVHFHFISRIEERTLSRESKNAKRIGRTKLVHLSVLSSSHVQDSCGVRGAVKICPE
jgi:hypothetical protein